MVQKRYSDLLGDILEQKHSKCTCPPEYFKHLVSKKGNPNKDCCQFGANCNFLEGCGEKSKVPVTCHYNKDKCTCFTQCICGPQPQLPVQLLQGTELDQVIDTQMCICGGNCFCESDTLITRPTTNCDKTRCICDVCLCRPDFSESRLLPTDFRNAIKKEPLMSTEERIKQEYAEIKQILVEHEENKKKEQEELNNTANDKLNKKQLSSKVSTAEDHNATTAHSDNKEELRESVVPLESKKSPELSAKYPSKEPAATTARKKETQSKKREKKKEKTVKRKAKQIKSAAIQSKATTPSQYTQYSCGCRMPKKRPLHMRYYFSGGTEHYGVKMGHKVCLPKPALVPKNMGWLWNLEDPSKGIRERKGWPPGFIAKNIKNMIKVMKQFDDPGDAGGAKQPTHTETGTRRFGYHRREQGEVGAEPQDEPPLLHIHKKGRTYNITFCPKSSDTDIGPIPIPFSITEKRRDSDSSTSESTLEFEFHSPKPRLPPQPIIESPEQEEKPPEEEVETTETTAPPPSTNKTPKKKPNKKRSSKSTEENKNAWEEQQTQMENIPPQ